MTSIPPRFTITQPKVLANYDFTDLTEQIGYVIYYANHNGSWDALLRQQIASEIPRKYKSISSPSLALDADFDWDFDLFFNDTILVGNGYLYVVVTIDSEAGSSGCTARLDVNVYKWDGSTETELATATGDVVTWGASHDGSYRCVTRVNLPLTKIKAGEAVRVNVRPYMESGGKASLFRVWADGADRFESTYAQVDADNTSAAIDVNVKNPSNIKVIVPYPIYL